jgi:hypothetical protein
MRINTQMDAAILITPRNEFGANFCGILPKSLAHQGFWPNPTILTTLQNGP